MNNKKTWTIYTSIHLFQYCYYSWGNHMWNHIHGFPNEKRMRDLFWHYLNYGWSTMHL